MGREIRKVPQDWEHPRRDDGSYQPLYDNTYLYDVIQYIRYELPACIKLKHRRFLKGFFAEWPSLSYNRPFWPERKATHFQMYETVTEGTPVSPVFATRGEIADWLVEQGHSRHASDEFAEEGWAPSMIFTGGHIYMGVDTYDLPKIGEER